MGQYKVIEPKVNDDRNLVPLEDLTIFVDLVAKIPGRSVINNNPILEIGGLVDKNISTEQDIHFTFPTQKKGEKPSLTTSWTNIGGITEEKTTEGFGITNIDIQFDASFVPRVTIDFIDIRGAALFEQGRSSKYYGAFFRLPYPVYLLQFKGYYGEAVTYPLHLMKFNSRFNGETGNFEIKCEFIGHTFAFLSDLLIGYALAAPYMTEGGGENIQCNCDGKSQVETIKDYIQKVKKVTNDVSSLQKSTAFKNYKSVTEFKPEIQIIYKFLNDIQEKYTKNTPKDKKFFIKSNFIKDSSKEKNKTYNELIDGILKSNDSAPFNQINERLKKIKIVEKNTQYFSNGNDIQVSNGEINFDYLRETIETVEEITNVQIKQLSNQLKEEAEEIKKENSFNATIKHSIDVLSCGFEIFLNRLKNTSELAESRYTNPADQITKKLQEESHVTPDRKPINKSQGKNPIIYPWPLYYEQSGVVKDANGNKIPQEILTYPGKNSVLADMEEVKFVEDFIDALVLTKTSLNADESLITEGDGWMPCNIVESPLWDDEINNPYAGLNKSGVLSRFVSRVLVNISYSYALGYTAEPDLDTFEFQPDIVGAKIADKSDFFRWDDAWESITSDIGYLQLLAKAEASNFYVSGVSDDIIKEITSKTGQGLLDDILSKEVNVLYVNDGKEIKFLKKEGGFTFAGVKSSGTSVNMYYCGVEENTGNRYDFTKNTDVRLEINNDIFVDGDSSGGHFSNFEIINESDLDEAVVPKTNSVLEEALGGAYGGELFSEGFCKVEFSPFNVLMFTNTDNYANTFDMSPYMHTTQRLRNRQPQGFDQDAWFINSKDVYNEKYINVCLESSDYRDDVFSGDEPSKYFLNANKNEDLYYGDFPFYIGDVYVGQIQDTYFYKLNKSNTATFTYSGTSGTVTYAMSSLSTAYLWLNSLEIALNSVSVKKSPLYCFSNANGIIELPKLWVLYIGAILWRYEQPTSGDVILFGNETILSGKTNTDQVVQSEKIPLGAHWDLLNNTSFYRDKIDKYLTEGVIIQPATNEGLISRFKGGAKYNLVTTYLSQSFGLSTQYDNYDNFDLIRTLKLTPPSIKNKFIEIFIEWATTSNTSTEFMDMSWSAISTEIEDTTKVRRHYSWLDNEYGLPRKSRIYKENIYKGNLTNLNQADRDISYPETTDGVEEYPNSGTYNNDKALFYSSYYKFTGTDSASGTTVTPNTITQNGYLNVNTLVPTGDLEIYSPKIRFISQELINLLNVKDSIVYVLNGSWRSFIPRNLRVEDSIGSEIGNDVAANRFNTFYSTETTLVTYLDAFIEKLREIRDNSETKNENNAEKILNDNDLKLALYLEFKNLYDKWIASELLVRVGESNICISSLFSYVDRAMNDIGDLAVINPKTIGDLYGNSQTSFYNIIYEVLSQNNFDFFPLPHFNGFGAVGDAGESKVTRMFEPTSIVGPTIFQPSFTCVYVGSRANTVDIEGSEYGNDVVDFDDDTKVSADFTTNRANVFRVTFGLENQNIFKTISLDQSDFKETSESLQVIDDLTKSSNEANNISFKGNDLFQVYSKRSYNCQVEMMGCAVVEPLMYFQLSNVPMFRGAYMIHQVSHNITPNHMTTSFTGVRIPYVNLPYVSDFAVALGLVDQTETTKGSKPKTVLDEDGNTVVVGDTKKQGNNTNSGSGWDLVSAPKDEDDFVSIVNRT